uniref:Bg55 protein n=1 Tax=Rhizophora mucronata TaxID=61149 RepID=A0A2P2NFV6_RHIMU
MQRNDDHSGCQSYVNTNETNLDFLSRFAELDWESQCKVVEDVKSHVENNEQLCHHVSYENSVEPLIRFLRYAQFQHDVRAQKSGSQLLIAFVSNKS